MPTNVILTSNQVKGLNKDDLIEYAIIASNAYQQIFNELFDPKDPV